MSNISSNGLLRIDRGDTFSFFYPINIGTELYPTYYELTENDKLYFAVMEPGQAFENALIKKVYTNDDLKDNGVKIKFKSTDTLYLFPGQYYYTIKLRTNIGTDVENIITLVSDRICWIQGNIPTEEELKMNLKTQLNSFTNKTSESPIN